MVSELCMGTMTYGSQTTDEDLIFSMLDRFVEAGGNFFDTAEMYPVPCEEKWVGSTEEIIGRWLKAREGIREKIVVATKVCGPCDRTFVTKNRTKENKGIGKRPNFTTDDILAACEGSLRRLQTSYIDVLYLHWPLRPAPTFGKSIYKASMEVPMKKTKLELEESILAMKQLIDSGKIRHWAISNETSFGVCTIVAECERLNVPKPVCIQNDFSLTDRRFETELAEACAPWNHNISGVPYGVLCGGFLTGKYLNGAKPKGARHVWKPSFQPRYHFAETQDAAEKYAAVAKAAGVSMVVLALAWAKQCFYNQSIIFTTNSMEQLEQTLSVSDVTLSDDTLVEIDRVHFEHKNPNVRL